jgi:hypothetical protein
MMKKHKPTSAQLRDRQKTQDLKRIADSLDDVVFLIQGAIDALTAGFTAAYELFKAEQKAPPPEKLQ